MPAKTKSSKITATPKGSLIKVHIHSRKPAFKVGKCDPWTKEWHLDVTSSPVKNQANEEIIRELKKKFNDCKLVLGPKSPHKVVWVNASTDEVEKAFK